jgi:spermidine/putrescine transport system permease protein
MGRSRFWDVLLLPGLVWLILLFLVPMGIVVAVSVAGYDILGRPVFAWHPGNYLNVLQWDNIRILLRSLTYAGVTTIICLAIGYPVAYTIARFAGRYKLPLIGLVVFPWLVDYLVRIYAWMIILGDNGLINGMLQSLGVKGKPPLQITQTPYAVILGLVYSYFPMMVLPLFAALDHIDSAIIEAGKDLYGTPTKTFLHVTLPVSWMGVTTGCLFVFLPCVGDFANAALLGGPSTYMVGNLITDQFSGAGDWNFGAGMTVLVMTFMWILILAYMLLSRRAVSSQAS